MLAWLKEPSLEGQAPGSPEFFARQKALILGRPLLKRCYDQWYHCLLEDVRSAPPSGIILELGSGGSYLKDLEPAILTSDVVAGVAEQVIDGRKLPFPDASVRALLLTHVFHHIPDVELFFREAQRVLVPGGVISMIEVAHTPFARFFFKRFHHEPYDDKHLDWAFAQSDSMMDSNQALSWLVFERDRPRFERSFPDLHLEATRWMPWLTYLVSGGVTARYLIPRFMNPLLIGSEFLLRPFAAVFALHWHIRVRKTAGKVSGSATESRSRGQTPVSVRL